MDINFNGFKENVLTFACDNTVEEGGLVMMTSSGKVTKAAENSNFVGVCVGVRDGYAAVQLEGYTEAAKNGTIKVKKGTKKGKYKMTVAVTAKGDSNYKSATRKVNVIVKVK